MDRDALQISFALEKKIYSYSHLLMSRYQMYLEDAIRSNKPVTADLYRELIGQLKRVLECEKAGCRLDLLPWRVEEVENV